ncbi:MAG TPA: DUF1987 domain-containing protein [Bacteroidales bacterium]
MEALLIDETKGTPRIRLYPNGQIFIEGRSLPENPVNFYTPVLEWIKNCTAESVTIEIRLEYMNTSSSKEMYTFFHLIKENPYIKNVSVAWYYEEGDDDGYDVGREFETITKLPFQFHEYAEATE